MTIKQLFDPASVEDQQFLLASWCPDGNFWEKTFDISDPLGGLLLGLAMEFYRFQVLERKLFGEMDIRDADELLVDWEQSVGIPGECFNNVADIATRRVQVEQVFSKFGGVQTAADFVRVGAAFGHDLIVIPGSTAGEFPLAFPFVFFDTDKDYTHTIFIQVNNDLTSESDFPILWPIPFSSGGATFLQCIFETLAPANVNVVVINAGVL